APRAWAGPLRLLGAFGRNRGVEFARQQASGRRILETIEKLTRDAKRRGDHTTRVAGVHPFGEYFDGELAAGEPAQRSRRPHALVVTAAGVEPDDEIDLA